MVYFAKLREGQLQSNAHNYHLNMLGLFIASVPLCLVVFQPKRCANLGAFRHELVNWAGVEEGIIVHFTAFPSHSIRVEKPLPLGIHTGHLPSFYISNCTFKKALLHCSRTIRRATFRPFVAKQRQCHRIWGTTYGNEI